MTNHVLNDGQNSVVELGLEHMEMYIAADPFLVGGLAGTGKTVALIELVRALMAAGHKPAVCAPTGKAAHVITGKAEGLFAARTLHSVLTNNPVDHLKEINAQIGRLLKELVAFPDRKTEIAHEIADLEQLALKYKSKSRMSFEPIDPEDFHMMYDCLVVDESSMIGANTMMREFVNPIRCPKFFFGDYGQLPPVQDKPAVNLAFPTVKLTEIHRQAADSGIISVAHHARNKKNVGQDLFEEFSDLTSEDNDDMKTVMKYAEDHQVLVWKNVTRHRLNMAIRRVRGFDYTALENEKDHNRPMIGEELLFDENSRHLKVFKGQSFRVVDVESTEDYLDRFRHGENPYITEATIEIDRPGGEITEVKVVLCLRDLIPPETMLMTTQKADDFQRLAAEREGIMCMYPYALTVHKAQGSEWPKVCVIGEYPARMDKFVEWFYTAATRASKELVVCSSLYFRKPKKRRTIAEIRAAREKAA